MKVSYTKPSVTKLEIDFVTDAVTNGWGASCYDYIVRFEKEFSDYIGAKFGLATSSCTGALTMGLNALDVSVGDEVILADTNWIATVAPVWHAGAKPVFVDIDPDTWCINPLKVEEAITSRTKVIIATHLYGNLCDMEQLLEIGRKYNIAVIEDAAEAIGSVYKGKNAGSMGSFSTFSFHGTKTLSTGEGGMFLTNDEELFERVLTLSNHGREKSQNKQFWADSCGFKFKMSNLQAALGCAQMERLDDLIERKRSILQFYRDFCENFDCISINVEQEGCQLGAWMPTVVFAKETGVQRELLLHEFRSADIDARVFFWPLSSLPMFETKTQNVNAYDISARSINLPSYHDITKSELDKVVITLEKIIKNNV